MKNRAARGAALLVGLALPLLPAPTSGMEATQYRPGVVHRMDQVRDARPTLRPSRCVQRVAQAHARVQHATPWYQIEHLSLARALYRCGAYEAGEVIDLHRGLHPRRSVYRWMHSPEHRKVLMRHRYTRIGIGVVHHISGMYLVVAILTDRARD